MARRTQAPTNLSPILTLHRTLSVSHTQNHNPNPSTPKNWQPPPLGHFKINFDAAWRKENYLSGLCAIVRDHAGILIDGDSELCFASSALEAECRAALLASNLARRLNPSPIIFESDSLTLIKNINAPVHQLHWNISPLIQKIWMSHKPSSHFIWLWTPRLTNCAADHVASLVVRKMCPEVWVLRPPSSLMHILSRDGLPCPPISSGGVLLV